MCPHVVLLYQSYIAPFASRFIFCHKEGDTFDKLKQSRRNDILTTLLWRFCCSSMCVPGLCFWKYLISHSLHLKLHLLAPTGALIMIKVNYYPQRQQQCSNVPMLKCSNAQMFKCLDVYMCKCSNLQMFKCSYFSMFQCSNVPMFQCSNVQMFKCSNVQLFKCLNV